MQGEKGEILNNLIFCCKPNQIEELDEYVNSFITDNEFDFNKLKPIPEEICKKRPTVAFREGIRNGTEEEGIASLVATGYACEIDWVLDNWGCLGNAYSTEIKKELVKWSCDDFEDYYQVSILFKVSTNVPFYAIDTLDTLNPPFDWSWEYAEYDSYGEGEAGIYISVDGCITFEEWDDDSEKILKFWNFYE